MGTYGLTPIKQIIISLENAYLMARVADNPKIQLFPESENQFFGKIPDLQIEFFNNNQGKINHLFFHQDGEEETGMLTH